MGTDIGCGTDFILRCEDFAVISVLGIAVANGPVLNIWVLPANLSSLISLFADL